VTLQALVEYHWPPFMAAVTRGGAGGIMCSANGYGIDGAPGQASCAHSDVNSAVLRAQWGFGGAMVTDGNGVGYLYQSYGPGQGAVNCGNASGATGPTNAVRVGLRGGVDVELGETLNNYALAAIADGNITAADIDGALARTLPFLFSLGLMDPPGDVPPAALGPADVDTEGARALAAQAAAQAVVLLRNDAGLIPLALGAARPAAPRTLAVIGPSADSAELMLANYHGANKVAAAHTPLAALTRAAAAAGASVRSAPGCATVLCPDTSLFAPALAAAAGADVVVYIGGGAAWRGGAGEFNATEGEEYDRTEIGLPGQQEALITALLAGGAPVVVVLLRGGPIGLSPALLAHPGLRTLLDCAYPGEMGGEGLADVLLGAVAPSGRLATTVYPPDFTATRSLRDYDFSSGQGVTHMYYTGQAQWVYGYGLSTTTWNLTWVEGGGEGGGGGGGAAARTLGAHARSAPPYAVNATNTGTRASDLSLLAFITPPQAGGPLQRLFDFDRAAGVQPGQSVTLYFTASAVAVGAVGADGAVTLSAGEARVAIGAPGVAMLHTTLRIETEAEGVPRGVSPAVALH
jgi:beta-glucosidase